MLGVLRLPPAGTLSTVQLLAWFPFLFITFLASIYALLKVPALTNHITALATDVFLGDPRRFADGRALASYVGIIPREYSSGERQRLGGVRLR